MSKNSNRLKSLIKWDNLKDYFTLKELMALNPDMKEITMRVRVNKLVKSGDLVVIGSKMLSIGRPQLVFVRGESMSDIVISKAEAAGVVIENKAHLVEVMRVNKSSTALPDVSVSLPVNNTSIIGSIVPSAKDVVATGN